MRTLMLGSALLLGGCAVKAPVMHTMGSSWGSECMVHGASASGGSLMQALPNETFERRMDRAQGQVDQRQMDRLDALRRVLDDKELEDRGPLGVGQLLNPIRRAAR
ncbi:MAG: hypothetical protein ACI9MC_001080 [Kiritimatiellia bacterium]|jgi:hypothetical protein